jgi:enoyl-CoA hydratase/carnithine racemase
VSAVLVERRGAVALFTLSNPAKRNALDPPMLAALVDGMRAAAADGARAAVLTGEGERAFSAGFDFAALAAMPPEGPSAHPLAAALAEVSAGALPTVAALNGVAVGGGCELAAACDLRVAHDGVTLAMPPVRLGLVYDPRGLARFVALIGMSRARELFLTAQPIDAARALAWGLVDRVVPAAEALPTALALAEEIARGAPLAIAGTRRIFDKLLGVLDGDPEATAIVTQAWRSEDAAEARAAIVARRPPHFRGR